MQTQSRKRRRYQMKFYEITDKDKELINVALNTLQNNFDDGIYGIQVNIVIVIKV